MDDRSRQLERDINPSRPRPYKRDQKPRILIVDDFGEMKSGEYLKLLVRILSVLTGICVVASALFYYIYAGGGQNAALTKQNLVLAEKKIIDLTREKEVLMARLVMSGKEPGIESEPEKKDADPVSQGEKPPAASETAPENEISLPLLADPEKNRNTPLGVMDKSAAAPESDPPGDFPRIIEKTVALEKFSVIKDGRTGDLLVRFDIRNISKVPGDVSGRIFVVLKPAHDGEDQWLVVPESAIKEGIPSEYKKGQYFSIAHFKPVKFRIKHPADPEFFKKASVFVFNEQADLIFEKLINITDAGDGAQ